MVTIVREPPSFAEAWKATIGKHITFMRIVAAVLIATILALFFVPYIPEKPYEPGMSEGLRDAMQYWAAAVYGILAALISFRRYLGVTLWFLAFAGAYILLGLHAFYGG